MDRPSQRQRLIDGMVAATARYGYGEASVARAIKLAGVSRATFYEHFANKDECFLAACRQLSEVVRDEIWREADDPEREILGALLAEADRDPAAARVVLVEARAGDAAARAEHERMLETVAAAIESHLRRAPAGTPVLGIGGAAALGGVVNVIAARVFRGEVGRLSDLREDLLAWLGSYTLPPGVSRTDPADWEQLGRSLAADPPRVAAEESAGRSPVAGGEQRQQIVDAVASLARDKGFRTTTVADVAAAAGISREAFYEQFRGKDDAFRAAQAYALEASMAVTASRFFGQQSWPDRVWNGLEAMFGFAVERPEFACIDLVESFAAGPEAIRRSIGNRTAFTLFLEDGYRQRPEAEALPRLCSEAIGGAIWELLRRRYVSGRIETAYELVPEVVYLALAPFVGPVEALELVRARCDVRRA